MVSNGRRCLSITINPAGIDGISRIVVNGLAVLVNDGRSRRGVDGHGFVDGGLLVDGQVQDSGAPIRSLGIDTRAEKEGDAQCQCLHVSDGLLFEQVFQGQAHAFADFRAFGNAFGGGFGFAFVITEGKQGVDDVLAFIGNGIRGKQDV